MHKIIVKNPDFRVSMYNKRVVNYSLGIFVIFPLILDEDFSSNVFGHAVTDSINLRAGVL